MEREDFKNKAKKSLDEIFAKIDELEAKKDKAFNEVKAEYEETISELKKKKDELLTKYNRLSNASEEDWEEIKNAFSSASVSFKDGVSKFISLFKNDPEETDKFATSSKESKSEKK